MVYLAEREKRVFPVERQLGQRERHGTRILGGGHKSGGNRMGQVQKSNITKDLASKTWKY